MLADLAHRIIGELGPYLWFAISGFLLLVVSRWPNKAMCAIAMGALSTGVFAVLLRSGWPQNPAWHQQVMVLMVGTALAYTLLRFFFRKA